MRRWGFASLITVAALSLACGGGGGDGNGDYPYPVQTFEDQGRDHLLPNQTYELYNSNPPTSGPHALGPSDLGVRDQPIPKEVPVHNMEHGAVVVWYDCSAGPTPLDQTDCTTLRDQLATVVEIAVLDGKQVLMVPYSGMDFRIALTAWRTLDGFDDFDEARVRAFIDFYERRFNPEGF